MLVSELLEELSQHLADPSMKLINSRQLLVFANSAARDLINSGWLLPIEHAENIELLSNEYEYDVPTNFAYIKEIRIGDQTYGNASTVDTGTEMAEALDATETAIDVDDGSIFTVNDLMQVDDEVMLVTAIATNTLTVTRGYFSTTAATHLDNANILRPLADTVFDFLVPRAYWRMKIQTGGSNTTTAALGSRAQVVFNARYFSFTAGTPLQFVGQRRPTLYTALTATLDFHIESYIRERAMAYAQRYASAVMGGGVPEDVNVRRNIAREGMANSEVFIRLHPQEFRVAPGSTRVPGR